jgi:hypothetical protein
MRSAIQKFSSLIAACTLARRLTALATTWGMSKSDACRQVGNLRRLPAMIDNGVAIFP